MTATYVSLTDYVRYQPEHMRERAAEFYEEMRRRRTVRHFSDEPIDRRIIEDCLRTAMTAPSGANRQPWRFVVVTNPAIKRRIRVAAEEEERAFYDGRAPDEWLEALAVLGTNANKPFLEIAPYLIVIFAESHGIDEQGRGIKNYYVQESVGIATGLLIAAVHHAGLASLTHTPSPMTFLNEILQRPRNERPYLILVVGYPHEKARVPEIAKKRIEEVVSFA
jgi:nitroreductase